MYKAFGIDDDIVSYGAAAEMRLRERFEEIDDERLRLRVKTGKRLVHNERVGIERKNARERYLALLAPRRCVRRSKAELFDPQQLERTVDAATAFLFRKVELPWPKRDFVVDAPAEELRVGVLKDKPDAPMKRLGERGVFERAFVDPNPVEPVFPARRKNEPVQEPKERRLAAPVGAHKRHGAPLRNAERDAVERGRVFVVSVRNVF